MSGLKDHEIANIVNKLRYIAVEYGHTQQLREVIAGFIVPILKAPIIPQYEMEVDCPDCGGEGGRDCDKKDTDFIAHNWKICKKCQGLKTVRVPMADGVPGIVKEVKG